MCPILREFRPELLIVACGVDASLFDPLSRLGVTAAGFAAIAERLIRVAGETCGGRLLSVQEGGYSHVYAPFCWLAIVETIAGLDRHEDPFEAFVDRLVAEVPGGFLSASVLDSDGAYVHVGTPGRDVERCWLHLDGFVSFSCSPGVPSTTTGTRSRGASRLDRTPRGSARLPPTPSRSARSA